MRHTLSRPSPAESLSSVCLLLACLCIGFQSAACRSQANPLHKLLAPQSDPSDLQFVQAWSLSDPSSQPLQSELRPGHKWDQFLPVPDHSTDTFFSRLKQRVQTIFTAWTTAATLSLSAKQALDNDSKIAAAALNSDAQLQDDDEPVGFTNSTWVPVLPSAIAWMMHDAEKRIDQAGVNLRKAKLLAQLTSVSYCNRPNIKAWNCTRCNTSDSLKKFRLATTVYDITWDLFAYAGYSTASELGGGAIVVAFRGTDSHSLYNWAENMRYWKTDFNIPYPGSEGAYVHTGFFMSYNASALAPNITQAVRELREEFPSAPLYVAGHSMGAAMAHICALDLKFTLGLANVNVYTFGSPRVGNDKFKLYFNKIVNESVRVTHNRDIVPSVPPQYVGFHHVSREVWQLDGEKYFGTKAYLPWVCDGSGEDSLCHNSVCFLGLCTSIVDHMQYLGAHMFHHGLGC